MANTFQPAEGIAIVQYKFVLTQGRTFNFDPEHISLKDAEIADDVNGNGTGLHTFRTNSPSFLESLKEAMSDANPVLMFRLGFGSPTNMYWLPWQTHIVTNYRAVYEGLGTSAGHLVVIQSANSLTRASRSTKVIARKGTVAEIVDAIAAENSLKTVVEPTDGKFIMYQSYMDDTSFIRERLLKRAINKNGRGGYYFFIKDDILHFHTPDFQSEAKALDYYKSTGTELALSDVSQSPELWDAGVAGARLINHDPTTGQTKEVDHEPTKALRLADSIYQFPNIVNGQRNIAYHQSFNPPVESKAIAQFAYQRSRQRVFKCSASFEKTIHIRHGDLLNLSIVQQTNRASSHSGLYYVVKCVYIYKNGTVNTTYILERGEVMGQDQSLSTQAPDSQIVPVSKAPGEDPNNASVASSQLTKGSGAYTGAASYSPVLDPETGTED